MIYKERLADIREDLGLKQEELAKVLNIKRNTYTQYETEYVIIPIKHLNILCNYLNVSIDYLFGLNDDLNYEDTVENIDMDLSARRLKEFRKENKLTQIKLGEILSASPAVIVHHENKRHILATPYLYMICKKYHISADYLLGKIDNPKYLK